MKTKQERINDAIEQFSIENPWYDGVSLEELKEMYVDGEIDIYEFEDRLEDILEVDSI